MPAAFSSIRVVDIILLLVVFLKVTVTDSVLHLHSYFKGVFIFKRDETHSEQS